MKRLKNRKGFTLIELLAVIIILAILMTLAITAMTGYIRNARKDTFITTAQQYANAARLSFVNNEYSATPGRGQCLVVKTNGIALESGSKQSSFDADFDPDNSVIIIYNTATAEGEQDKYEYYMQMVDNKGNGFGVIGENAIDRDNVIEKDTKAASSNSNYQNIQSGGTIDLDGDDGTLECSIVAIE